MTALGEFNIFEWGVLIAIGYMCFDRARAAPYDGATVGWMWFAFGLVGFLLQPQPWHSWRSFWYYALTGLLPIFILTVGGATLGAIVGKRNQQ